MFKVYYFHQIIAKKYLNVVIQYTQLIKVVVILLQASALILIP